MPQNCVRSRKRTHDKPTVLISDWDVGMSVTHFGRDSAVSLVEADPLYAKTYDITVPLSRARSLPTDVELLLLDLWEPTPLNAFFRSKAEIEQQREEYSVRREAERRWGLRCDLLAEGTHPLYRCVRVDAGAADTPSAVAPSADAPSQEPQAATDHRRRRTDCRAATARLLRGDNQRRLQAAITSTAKATIAATSATVASDTRSVMTNTSGSSPMASRFSNSHNRDDQYSISGTASHNTDRFGYSNCVELSFT